MYWELLKERHPDNGGMYLICKKSTANMMCYLNAYLSHITRKKHQITNPIPTINLLLKSIGFRYAPKKKCWCWHYGEYRRHYKKEVSLDDIRAKYGSEKVRNKTICFELRRELCV